MTWQRKNSDMDFGLKAANGGKEQGQEKISYALTQFVLI